jgi:hypothetical protein
MMESEMDVLEVAPAPQQQGAGGRGVEASEHEGWARQEPHLDQVDLLQRVVEMMMCYLVVADNLSPLVVASSATALHTIHHSLVQGMFISVCH